MSVQCAINQKQEGDGAVGGGSRSAGVTVDILKHLGPETIRSQSDVLSLFSQTINPCFNSPATRLSRYFLQRAQD